MLLGCLGSAREVVYHRHLISSLWLRAYVNALRRRRLGVGDGVPAMGGLGLGPSFTLGFAACSLQASNYDSIMVAWAVRGAVVILTKHRKGLHAKWPGHGMGI